MLNDWRCLVPMNKIRIDNKIVGDDFPCYTIAEAGANHD